jgi:hypothetical protein
MTETKRTAAKPAPAQAGLAEELKKMEEEYEPLLPVEKKLIGGTLLLGLVLLIVLVGVSRLIG